jgi:hypothetical protein
VVNCVVSASIADFVTMIWRYFITSSKQRPPGVTARTSGRFRDALAIASSRSPSTISALRLTPSAVKMPRTSRVFGAVSASSSTTVNADSATRAESADFMASAASCAGTSLWRAGAAKTTPPPVQCGARRSP